MIVACISFEGGSVISLSKAWRYGIFLSFSSIFFFFFFSIFSEILFPRTLCLGRWDGMGVHSRSKSGSRGHRCSFNCGLITIQVSHPNITQSSTVRTPMFWPDYFLSYRHLSTYHQQYVTLGSFIWSYLSLTSPHSSEPTAILVHI